MKKYESKIKVKLMDVSVNAKQLIYLAGRQCYSADWVGDYTIKEDGSIYDPKENKVTDKEIVGLIKHLVNSGHTSVLEHIKFTFSITGVSRAETHQQVRHRISSYSQQSQRYVTNYGRFDMSRFVIPPTIQNNPEALDIYEDTLRAVQCGYNALKDLGIPSEDARYLMPNASITSIVDTKNCVNLLHFFNLRCCTLAQWEIRDLANKMLAICKEVLPEVFEGAGARCISLGFCPESKKRSCGKYPTKQEVLEVYKKYKNELDR